MAADISGAPLCNLSMRFLAAILAAVAVVLTTRATAQSDPSARTHLVIVVDGLRPDYVTPVLMPRLVRLGQRGIVFNAHHSAFPTVTRVNASDDRDRHVSGNARAARQQRLRAVGRRDARARHSIARESRGDCARGNRDC